MNLDTAQRLFAHDLGKVSELRNEQKTEWEMYWNRVDGEQGQWTSEERQGHKDQKRKSVSINEIRPSVKLISGVQRQAKLDIHYFPTEGQDVQTAALLNFGFKYIANRNGYEFLANERFKEGLIKRESYTVWTPNFDQDPKGDILVEKEIAERIIWDADSEKYDRSDAERVFQWKWISPMKIKIRFGVDIKIPAKGEMDGMLNQLGLEDKPASVDLPVDEQDYRHRKGSPLPTLFLDTDSQKVRLIKMWYKKAVDVFFVIDLETEQIDPLPFETKIDAMEFMANSPMNYALIEKTIERIFLYTYCWDKELENLEWGYFRKTDKRFIPYTRRLPVAPYYAEFFDGKISGMITDLLDPQRERNRRRMHALHIMTTLINSGVVYTEGSVVNESELESLGSKPGIRIVLKKGARYGIDFVRLDPTTWPTGIFQYEQEAKQNIHDISGANIDLRGIKEGGSEPGYAISLRQRAGLTQVEEYFDNERRTKQIEGSLALDLMQSVFTYHKILRIAGENPVEINVPTAQGIINDITVGDYDVNVDVSKSAPSLRYANLEQVISLRRDLKVVMPDQTIVKLTDIPEDTKQEILRFESGNDVDRFLQNLQSLPPEQQQPIIQELMVAAGLMKMPQGMQEGMPSQGGM